MAWAELLGRHPGIVLFAWLAAGASVGALAAWRLGQGGSRSKLIWAGAGGAIFAVLAVGQGGAASRQVAFDAALAASLAQHAPAPLLEGLALFTTLGDRNFLIGLGAAVLLVLLWRRRWKDAGVWVAATAVAGYLNTFLKASFARVRPEHVHGFAEAHGWSFPSGHATGALSVYGMLAWLLLRTVPGNWRLPVAGLAGMLVAAIGYSRVVLQVHYFSDVLAAYAVTGAWLLACVLVSQREYQGRI
ncbi:Membrane-associated phospholipid phosphatase [plant metagenome]|uniref:Membrane-associated phospholipid phosphatase n=2 Tax=root TaxID=1 RepID=A0A1C3K7J5_9BURK|nr:phosphatase PAP2 family protein [Orrella dioscoreae]SBT27442.1 Membrane-associated phospholipid phosphatase [Orrella dioscoreae]SOE48266.1 Membrane-associated phospholipid phosphatase [Orrella dioscoreae]